MISLADNSPEPTQSISLDAGGQAVAPVTSDVAASRARKAEFGLGPVTGVTKEVAAQSIDNGQEMQLRRAAALEIDRQKSDQKAKLIENLARQQGGSITQGQSQFINDKYTLSSFLGQSPPTDPNSVFEEYYSGQYLKPMWDVSDQFNKGSFIPEAQKEIPEHVDKIKATSQSLTEARERINTRLENARAAAADQSYFGRAVDFGKELFPGYSESALKGGWSKIFEGGLRGTALRQQARELWAMPPGKMMETFNARMDELEKKDPALAVEYGEHMLGFSTSEENLQNFFTTLDVASIPAAAIGRGVVKGIRAGARVTGITEALAKKAELYNSTAKAASDAVKSTEGPGIPLRTLVNQHFGQEGARLDYEKQQLSKEFKKVAAQPLDTGLRTGKWEDQDVFIAKEPPEAGFGNDPRPHQKVIIDGKIGYVPVEELKVNPVGIANEGQRSQRLDSIIKQMNDIEKQKKDLKDWHASYMVDGPDEHVIVNQTVGKDPAVASAVGRGDLKTAGLEKAAVEVTEELKGTANTPKNSVEALMDGMRGDIETNTANPGHGGQEFVNRLREGGDAFIKSLQRVTQNIMRAQRIPGILANKEALKAIVEYTKDLYPGIRNSILNISDPIFHRDLNWYSQRMTFGRMTGELFQSRKEAEQFAELNGLHGIAGADQQGLGWYLYVERPLEETMQPIRDWLIKTKEATTPGGWLNATVGWLRTPEDTLSFEQNMQRKLVTYNASPFMAFAKEAIRDIKGLGGLKHTKDWYAQWKEWERVVAHARDAPVPGSLTNEKGYFFKPEELDAHWLQNFEHLPSIAQKAAYYQYQRIVEYDRVLRSMSLFRNKVRLGVEGHSISVLDAEGKTVKSNYVDGVRRSELPGGVHNVYIVDRSGNNIYPANAIPDKAREELKQKIAAGELQVIELYSPGSRPLEGFHNAGDARIRYVVAKNIDSQPIDVTQQLPRKGGGHFDYDYEHYIKQANMRYDEKSGVHFYEGDTTVMPIGIRAMGMDVVGKLNAVRKLIEADKIEEAHKLADETIPAIPWDEHYGWYQPSKNAEGRMMPPRLNKHEDFRVVSKDRMISDIDNTLKERYENKDKGFEDATKQGSLDKVGQVQYTGQRDTYDLHTLRDIGTRNNPIYKYEPAQFVDPMTVLNRSLSRIVNSTLMDDYKIYSVESWIREARNWLDPGNRTISDIDRSPFYYFNYPEWKKDMPADIKAVLMGNKLKIDRLVGTASKNDAFFVRMAQSLQDSIYKVAGPRAVEIAPTWLLSKLDDPTRFLRSIVFNEKMGLFSIPQFMVHAMTYANVMGIAGPKNATTGAIGALLHGWATINKNPAILEQLDKYAAEMGWKPGHWQEAFEAANRTGFMDVAGEHVFLDAPMANKLIQNKGASFLDAGQIFFRGGVKSLRAGSWYTAFKEFRDVHPIGKITDDDLKGILYRADLLSHNMSRASTSTLTTGVLAAPAQFYTYWLRLTEMMMGKRLTTMEKTRLFGVNAALFGAPVATGLIPGLGFFMPDQMRSYAQQNNYQVGENFLTTGLMEGLPNLLTGVITGHYYNIGERYGAPKAEPIENILEGDKTFLQIYGGAAFNSLSNTVEQTSGLMHLVMSGIRGDGQALGNATPEDFMGPFKEITSANSIFGIIAAVRYGNYLSKNNAVLHPTSPMQAMVKAVLGLTEHMDTDMWTKSQDLKANQAYERKLLGMFENRFTLGMQETNNKNYEQANSYFKEAFSILHQGGYPEDKIPEAVATAFEANKDNLVDRMNYNYWLKQLLPRQLGTK